VISGAVAVTGANGRVGGRVVSRLATTGVPVVALARNPGRVAVDIAADVECRRSDYDDHDSVRAALAGVAALVFVSSDGEADVVLRQHLAVVSAAAAAGVRRVAYLSSIDADPVSPFCFGRTNGATEQALLAAIDDVRIVRAGLFADFVHALMGEEVVRLPDAGRFAMVTREDAADALVAAVLDDGPSIGPSIRIAAEAGDRSFAEIAAGLGRQFVAVTLDDYRTALVAAGEDPWWSYAYTSMMQSIAEGRFVVGRPG
jgi:NAD(P)H dehydrogenase (quinone)